MATEIKTPFNKSMRTKTCAAQLFGSWMIEPKWFAKAIEAVRSGKLKPAPAASEDDDKKEKEKPRLTVAELDDDYGEDEEKGYKVVRVEGKAIAVICIEGTMLKYRSSFGGCSTVEVRRAVRAASNDRMVDAIMLYIDSPGGSCSGTSDLAADVVEAGKRRPVYTFFANMGASAAYWVGSQAAKVWANEIALVGSIGTYCVLEDDTKLQEGIGVKLTVVSTGPYKGLGADGKVTEQLVSDVQREIDDLNERFLVAVAAGRGMDEAKVRALADGRVHVGAKAVQEGLVDVIGTFDAALQALSQEKPMAITRDQFDAYAAEHPDATERFVKQGYDKASAELAPKPATIQDLEALLPGRSDFALAQLKANATLAAASIAAVALMTAETAAAKKTADDAAAKLKEEHKAELAAKDKQIFEATGRKPIGGTSTAGGADTVAGGGAADELDEDADPKERAQAEWKDNKDKCRSKFVNEVAYVGFRTAELRGGVRMTKAEAAG